MPQSIVAGSDRRTPATAATLTGWSSPQPPSAAGIGAMGAPWMAALPQTGPPRPGTTLREKRAGRPSGRSERATAPIAASGTPPTRRPMPAASAGRAIGRRETSGAAQPCAARNVASRPAPRRTRARRPFTPAPAPKSGASVSCPASTMPRRDGARAGEVVVQHGPVSRPDRALKREQLLGEASEDFERGVPVGQEHVAPHGGV